VRFSLPYGNDAYELDLPSRGAIRLVGETFPPPIAEVEKSLRDALEAPLGTIPLRRIVPPAGSISVLISDLTRGASTGKVLSALLAYLEEAGAGPERVSVVLAMGTHRGHREGELESHLGAGVLSRWKVIEHNAADPASLVDVGTTAAGTRCLFNAGVANSALIIALGTVSFHYFAGYGGGRKLILPGVAGEETILANHRLSLRADPGEGLSPGCRSGNLDGNPVHDDMLAGARLLDKPIFAVNVASDQKGNIVFLNAGELDRSHRAACDFFASTFGVRIDRLYKAVIVSAGGFPKDINLLQSHKALRHASYALEDGGVMLAAAACAEGVGSESYLGSFRKGRHEVPAVVRKGYTLNAQTAMSTFELTERFSIYLRSRLPDSLVTRLGICPWKDEFSPYLIEAVADEDVLVMRYASHFLPTKD
jgi:nickel-dependent lactate racemase